MRAFDPDGDPLVYHFVVYDSAVPAPLDVSNRAQVFSFSDKATFSWTPIGDDVGEHRVDFTVSDGVATDIESTVFTVQSGDPGMNAPRFVEPLGYGDTVDLAVRECIDLPVVVRDPDTLDVEVSLAPPIEGAEFESLGNGRWQFHWCPDPEQQLVSRWIIYLTAEDGQNPPVQLNDGQGYQIILVRPDDASAAGGAAQ